VETRGAVTATSGGELARDLRRHGGEDLHVLQVVVGVAQPRPHELQVGPHLALGEHLADLGDELTLSDVAPQELQLVHVLLRGGAVERPLAVEYLQVGPGDPPRPLQRGRLTEGAFSGWIRLMTCGWFR
jgi:hypothetical protein